MLKVKLQALQRSESLLCKQIIKNIEIFHLFDKTIRVKQTNFFNLYINNIIKSSIWLKRIPLPHICKQWQDLGFVYNYMTRALFTMTRLGLCLQWQYSGFVYNNKTRALFTMTRVGLCLQWQDAGFVYND